MVLTPEMTEAVLAKLGLGEAPAPDAAGLARVYGAWCRSVPFDNLVKRTHLVSGSPDPIPNGPPDAFFASWLAHGTGGTCWPSSGGLHALLVTLAFDARRGSAAMFDNLSGPIHTHGTTIVRVDGRDHWVDSSMLTDVTLPLEPHEPTRRDHAVSPIWSEPVDDLWRVWWTSPVNGDEIGCLLLDDDASADHYLDRYEWSRGWSPFNTSVYATRNIGDARVSIAGGHRFERRPQGITSAPLGEDRDRVLVEEFGYSEEFVARLPVDDPPNHQE